MRHLCAEPIGDATRHILSGDSQVGAAIRGFGVGEQTRMDPRAVVAVGRRIGTTEEALRRATADAGSARFGPDAMSPELRAHGVAYAEGMATLGAVVAALAESVTHLTRRFDTAAAALTSTDRAVGTDIAARGRSL